MNKDSYLVITEVSFAPTLKDRMEEMGRKFATICAKQSGFRSISFISSHDNMHTRSIMEWDSKADHEACMQSPDFNKFNSEWGQLTANGEIKFTLNTYDILETI